MISISEMAEPIYGARGSRQRLSNNSSSNGAGSSHANDTSSNGGADASNGIKFSSREDVEKLLAERMIERGKFKFEGKAKQMSNYFKRISDRIKNLMAREDANRTGQARLQPIIESEEKSASGLAKALLDTVVIKVHEGSSKRLQENNGIFSLQAEVAKGDEIILMKALLDTLVETARSIADLKIELDNIKKVLQQTRDESATGTHKTMSNFSFSGGNNKINLSGGYKLNAIGGNSAKMAGKDVLEETCSSQAEKIRALHHEVEVLKEKVEMATVQKEPTAVETLSEYESQKKTISDLHNHLADKECQLREAEKLRKELHNTILELKGNTRVFCRVRPVLPDGDSDGTVVSFPTSTELLGRGIELIHNAKTNPFTFDKVFNHEATQDEVFVEISRLVQSALDGYKVCIFAYGQTGSGKTYTMMGGTNYQNKGLIPRSLEQIFESSQSKLSQGWKYKMQASMLEIYNETIRDLLSSDRSSSLDIKTDAHGNTHVSGLTVLDVRSANEVTVCLKRAEKSRSVGKTQMNEKSSRSHFVFTLRISGVNENTKQQVQGVLNLIDLAGSERLDKSGATDDRLRETQAINKSLSSLRDVISAIASKKDHVPFRNSKLTHLLQPCLGEQSKTLMIVNISPEASSSGESFGSLQFAASVNLCEIGIAKRQTHIRVSE